MNRRKVLSAAVPLSLAGCLRLEEQVQDVGGDDSEGGNDGGSDDADGNGDDGSDGELNYPTGMSDDGISAILSDTHRNAVSQLSGTVDIQRQELTHQHDPFRFHTDVEGTEAIAEITWNGSATVTMHFGPGSGYWRTIVGGEPSYGQQRQGMASDIGFAIRSDELRALLGATEWESPETDEDAREFSTQVIGVDREQGLSDAVNAESIESASGTCTVDEAGYIRELDVEYEFQHDGQLFVNRLVVETTDVGTTNVTEPAWFDEAVERAPEVTTSFVEDRQFIEVVHEDGNPLLPGVDFTIHSEREGRGWGTNELSQPLEAGETVYLYVEEGRGRFARGSIPESASPDSLDGGFAVWARLGMEYFFTETR